MTRARRTHEAKNFDDRVEYQRTRIQKAPTPTVDESLFKGESTEDALAQETQPTKVSPTRKPAARRPRESAFAKYLKDKWPEMAILVVLATLAVQLFQLNREVGELRVATQSSANDQQRLSRDLERTEERLQKQMDRLSEDHDVVSPQPEPDHVVSTGQNPAKK